MLHGIQADRRFVPITVQLAPTEACDSDCPFCSVQNRPVNKRISWPVIERLLHDFRELGAKSIEITGGGNPLLYRDGAFTINHVIQYALNLGFKVGVITNSERPLKHITPHLAAQLAWLRVSLIKLDEGKAPEDYDFAGIPAEKIGLSYIIYSGRYGKPGTTVESIEKIAKVVELNPDIKFVRVAPDCLTDESLTIKAEWGGVVAALDKHSKFFLKEINEDYHPFDGGCWVGMLRPYVVWNGVYICTSHVLLERDYRPSWKLCEHGEVSGAWAHMNQRFADGLPPYEIDVKGKCGHCYYRNNNAILDAVVRRLPDWEFA